ncbi:MAG: IS481 family transposase [Deltaproteobacteria bacterium]|nr:IS481 family transposase [Deltaproteobacteria bacterium]
MNMHKRIRLTPLDRQEIWRLHGTGNWTIVALAQEFRVSRPTIYKVLHRARKQEFAPRKSTNKRFLQAKYGMKRLAKVEVSLERKKKAQARRYNKKYPGEMVHFDTKRLPLLKGETKNKPREYLFVGIDDFSRELYAGIFTDKTQDSAAAFLKQVIEECPYTIECAYSDNGTEYKGTPAHSFVALCKTQGIGQGFTRVKRPQTNGKAERVIKTLIEMWHEKFIFDSRQDRQIALARFVNFYNTVKPHTGINNMTPYELLTEYFKL